MRLKGEEVPFSRFAPPSHLPKVCRVLWTNSIKRMNVGKVEARRCCPLQTVRGLGIAVAARAVEKWNCLAARRNSSIFCRGRPPSDDSSDGMEQAGSSCRFQPPGSRMKKCILLRWTRLPITTCWAMVSGLIGGLEKSTMVAVSGIRRCS